MPPPHKKLKVKYYLKRGGEEKKNYFCSMKVREKFGDWLLDVSKYVATAVILSTAFGSVTEKWVIYIGGAFAVVTSLVFGLLLVRGKRKGV